MEAPDLTLMAFFLRLPRRLVVASTGVAAVLGAGMATPCDGECVAMDGMREVVQCGKGTMGDRTNSC